MSVGRYRIEIFERPPSALREALRTWRAPTGFEELTIAWCELVRAANPGRIELRWVAVWNGSALRAVGVMYVARGLAIGDYVGGRLERLTNAGRRIGVVPLKVDVAFLEIPFVNREGLFFAAEVEAGESEAITQAVTAHLSDRLRVDVLCVKSTSERAFRRSLRQGTLVFPFLEFNLLELPTRGDVREEWLSARSANQRHSIRQKRRAFAKSGAILETLEDPAPHAERLAELFARTAQRARGRGEVPLVMDVGRAFFERFHDHMGRPGIVRVVRMGGEIVAFSVLLTGHDTLFLRFVGLDYEVSNTNFAYFVLAYDTVDVAVERGLRYVDMGSGTAHVKAPLGCRQFPMAYNVHFRGILRPIGPLVSRVVARRLQHPVEEKPA